MFEEIKEILNENNIKTENLNLDTDLSNSGIDSLDLMEIILKIEDKYNIELSDEELNSLNNFQDIITIIENKIK